MKSLSLFFMFVFCMPVLGNGVINLVQVNEKQVLPGEAISLMISSNSQIVNNESASFMMQYILPYVFVHRVIKKDDGVFFEGFVTNSAENFQPIIINNKNILFNITNENIKKDPIELEEGFYLFSERFIDSIKKTYQALIAFLILLIAFLIYKFLYPKILTRKKWNREQTLLAYKLEKIKNIENLEGVYRLRQEIIKYFNFDEKDFSKALKIIEQEQYKKEWDLTSADEALQILNKVKFEKRKYDRA